MLKILQRLKEFYGDVFRSFHIDHDSEPIQNETMFYFLSLPKWFYEKFLKLQHNVCVHIRGAVQQQN